MKEKNKLLKVKKAFEVYEKSRKINVVIAGHVDSGKSTLIG